MEIVWAITEVAACITAVMTAAALFIKPIRNKIFNAGRTLEGEKCLLRSEMLRIYYRNLDRQEIRQYEFENFIKLFEAYKSLGGNSFIDEVNLEVRQWKIIR